MPTQDEPEPLNRRPAILRIVAVLVVAGVILWLLRGGGVTRIKALLSPVRSPNSSRVAPSLTNKIFQIARWDFISFTTGWAEVRRPPGNAGLLYATADAGRSWRQLGTPATETQGTFDLQALDSHHLLATTTSPDALWWSNDGGKTWENRSPPSLNQAGPAVRSRLGHFFLDTRHGWLLDSPSDPSQADQPSVLWATTDGGVTWSQVSRLDPRGPEFAGILREGLHVALSFRDPTTGWLGIRFTNESRLYRTDDGGRTWRLVTLPIRPLLISDVARTPDGTAIVITSNGYGLQATAIVSRDGGDHWESPRQLPDALGGIPFGMAFVDHDYWLYAYGDDVFVTKDAGQTWTSFIPSVPLGHRVAEVKFADRLHGWANGGDSMLRSEDGGRSWSSVGPP